MEGAQAFVFLGGFGGKEFLEDDHLIGNLGEFVEELAMVDGGMDLEAELIQGGLGGFLQFRRAQSEQRGLVGGGEKLEFNRHGII